MANEYKEITIDRFYPMSAYASNNQARYILMSAKAHDMYNEFREKHQRNPHSSWFNRNFRFYNTKAKPKVKQVGYVSSDNAKCQC